MITVENHMVVGNSDDYPAARICYYCERCGSPIYEGNDCYQIGEEYYCYDCVTLEIAEWEGNECEKS